MIEIRPLLDGPYPSLDHERETMVWHPSSLGKCLPKMMLDYFGVDTMQKDAGLYLTCQVHDAVRDLLAERLAAADLHPDVELAVRDDGLNLAGHIDVIWDGGLADIKTANPWSFKQLTANPEKGYWWNQLEAYARMADRAEACVVLVDRASAPGAAHIEVYDHHVSDERWEQVVTVLTFAQQMVELDEMPDRDTIMALVDEPRCANCDYLNFCTAYDKISEFVEAVEEAFS
jgi:hypothetical protein